MAQKKYYGLETEFNGEVSFNSPISINGGLKNLTIENLIVTNSSTENNLTVNGDATFPNGVIIKSPNDTLYRITVTNAGIITSTPV